MAAAPAPMLLQRASLAAAISALSEAQLGVGGYSKLQRMRTLARKTNFFAQLPQRLINALLQRLSLQNHRAGTVLQRAGELAPRLQIVLSGALAAVEGDCFLGSLGEGDCFGVGSLLHGTPAAATVLCSSDASVAVLLRESYLEEFAAYARTREPPRFVLPQLPLDEPVALADADEVEIEEWQPELASAFERRFGADAVASALRAAPVVQRMGLHDKVIEEWAREAERRVFEPSQLVFAQGDKVDEESHIFLVISGSLSEHRAEHAPVDALQLAESRHSRLEDLYGPSARLLLPGDLFGEAELRLVVEARGQPGKTQRLTSAIARERTMLLAFSARSFVSMLHSESNARLEEGFEKVRAILKLPPNARSQFAVEELVHCLRHLDFFAAGTVDRQTAQQLCRVLSLRRVARGALVCRQGDVGNDFFIIMSGRLSIHVKQRDQEDEESLRSQRSLTSEEEASFIAQAVASGSLNAVEGLVGPAVTLLSPGNSFGERSVVNEAPRGASAICLEDSEFLVVAKGDYLRLFGRRMLNLISNLPGILTRLRVPHFRRSEEDVDTLVDRLRSINFFLDMPLAIRRFVASNMSYERFGADMVLYEEGDKAEHFFIILRGSVAEHSRIQLRGGGGKEDETEGAAVVADAEEIGTRRRSSVVKRLATHSRTRGMVFRQKSAKNLPGLAAANGSDSSTPSTAIQPNSTTTASGEGRRSLHRRQSSGMPRGKRRTEHLLRGSIAARRGSTAANVKLGAEEDTGFDDPLFMADLASLFGQRRSVLTAGMHFGGHALENSLPRECTVITREPCDCVLLSRTIYLRAMRRAKEQVHSAQDEWAAALRGVPAFASMPRLLLQRVAFCLERRVLRRGETLYKQGEVPECAYLILHGECRLVCKLAVSPVPMEAATDTLDVHTSIAEQSAGRPSLTVVTTHLSSTELRAARLVSPRPPRLSERCDSAATAAAAATAATSLQLSIDLALAGTGAFLGLEIVERAAHAHTARVSSDELVVLVFKRRLFANGVVPRNAVARMRADACAARAKDVERIEAALPQALAAMLQSIRVARTREHPASAPSSPAGRHSNGDAMYRSSAPSSPRAATLALPAPGLARPESAPRIASLRGSRRSLLDVVARADDDDDGVLLAEPPRSLSRADAKRERIKATLEAHRGQWRALERNEGTVLCVGRLLGVENVRKAGEVSPPSRGEPVAEGASEGVTLLAKRLRVSLPRQAEGLDEDVDSGPGAREEQEQKEEDEEEKECSPRPASRRERLRELAEQVLPAAARAEAATLSQVGAREGLLARVEAMTANATRLARCQSAAALLRSALQSTHGARPRSSALPPQDSTAPPLRVQPVKALPSVATRPPVAALKATPSAPRLAHGVPRRLKRAASAPRVAPPESDHAVVGKGLLGRRANLCASAALPKPDANAPARPRPLRGSALLRLHLAGPDAQLPPWR